MNKFKVYRTDKIITRDKIRQNPDVLYLFGDNLIGKGLGGQAKEMRGEPNCIGIVTKKYPSMKEESFFTDNDWKLFMETYIERMDILQKMIDTGKYRALVIPTLGAGLAKLPEKAPIIWKTFTGLLDDLEKGLIKTTVAGYE